MNNKARNRPTATATLMISSSADAQLQPKPAYSEDFEITEEAYGEFPSVFTLTELPQPAIVAADCIENYHAYLEAIPADERGEYDLDVDARWADVEAVKRFMNRSLEAAFGGAHFTVEVGLEHIRVGNFYLQNPTYSFTIADADGESLDFYSAPEGFEQPLRIEARVNVHCSAMAVGA
ncbi:MAG: hypothetical protein AAGG01_10350 [Planctomycetota bacterium]